MDCSCYKFYRLSFSLRERARRRSSPCWQEKNLLYEAFDYSRVEIIWGIAPVRGPKQALSLLDWILTKNCDVLPHIMHEVTFTSPLTFHMVCVSVCLFVQGCRKSNAGADWQLQGVFRRARRALSQRDGLGVIIRNPSALGASGH